MEDCECLKSSFLFDLARQVFDIEEELCTYRSLHTHTVYVYTSTECTLVLMLPLCFVILLRALTTSRACKTALLQTKHSFDVFSFNFDPVFKGLWDSDNKDCSLQTTT